MDQDLLRGRTRFVLGFLGRELGFMSAHELHRRISRLGYAIGLSTVYRALRDLREQDLVDVMLDVHGQRRYRRCSTSPHHHLVCSVCHSTLEIPADSPPLPAWAPDDALGFTDVLARVTITGTCTECAHPAPTAADDQALPATSPVTPTPRRSMW